MSLYNLKPQFQNLLRPFVKIFFKLNISPNMVTITTCLLSCIYSYFIYSKSISLLTLPIFFFIRMALNAIDGMLAKEFNQQSSLGAILNELTDVVSDSALYFSLISFEMVHNYILCLFIFLAILTEIAGLSALTINKKRRFDGPMGKSDRAFFISLVAIFYSTISGNNIDYGFILANILLIFTVLNRIKKALNS